MTLNNKDLAVSYCTLNNLIELENGEVMTRPTHIDKSLC